MSAETTQQTASRRSMHAKSAPALATEITKVRTAALPVFLTPEQVAAMLQVDERTVLRWAQQDASIPVTRLGRVIRFEREPLLRWLARKRHRSAQGPTQSAVAAS